MGGRPITALNVVMFPAKHLDMGVLREILRGGSDKTTEAGASLVGGHTVNDDEPKYGLCVNGTVHPDRVITNAGSRPGDALILTKPVGSGVLFNAVRDGKMSYSELEREVLPTVATLNAAAMEVALGFDLHACTDITGFGIVGHLFEIATGCQSTVRLEFSSLPLFPGVIEMYRKGVSTASNLPNRVVVQEHLVLKEGLTREEQEVLFDPQTSGGLLLSIPESQADELIKALRSAGVDTFARVGSVVDGPARVEVI
jgi:selenide,water dikinase